MKFYFAPMEGVTGYVFRQAQFALFDAADKYFSPFISPTQNYCFASKGDFLAVKSEFGLHCIGSDHKPLYTVLYLIPEEFKS